MASKEFQKLLLKSFWYYKQEISNLGFAFKANTNDTRESAAITICKTLLNEGANLVIYDPKVNASKIENDLNRYPKKFSENNDSFDKKSGDWEYSKSIDKNEI